MPTVWTNLTYDKNSKIDNKVRQLVNNIPIKEETEKKKERYYSPKI